MPDKKLYRDITLDENESILATVRPAKVQLVLTMVVPTLIIGGTFFFLASLLRLGVVGSIVAIGLLAFSGGLLLRSSLIWYNQVFIITNHKLIDIDRPRLFSKTVSSAQLSEIKNVLYRRRGFWQTISNLGTVVIELIDNQTSIEVSNISEPQKIQRLIIQQKNLQPQSTSSNHLTETELLAIIDKIKNQLGEEKFNELLDA